MLLEESAGSTSPVRVAEPHFKIRPEFRDIAYDKNRKSVSYAMRYEIILPKAGVRATLHVGVLDTGRP
jgi:hypothetical protein